MDYCEIEGKLREYLHRVLKDRTSAFLSYLDMMKSSDSITRGESDRIEVLKGRGKGLFMEVQNELLAGMKCLLETGDIPEAIDRRANKL